MKCSQCGADAVPEAVYCHQCGDRIAEQPDETSPREKIRSAVSHSDADDPPERELWQGKYSKLAMIGSWIGAGVFTLVMLAIAVAGDFSGRGWLFSLALIAIAWLSLLARLFYRQLSEHYFLTNLRFIHERGMLWRNIDRIEAIDIDDVSFQQGPVERMMGVGTICVRSSDNSHPEMELPGIENVRDVAEMIDEVRRQERRRRGLHIEAV